MLSSEQAKILVVDDLPEKILVYRAILEQLGQQLVVAHSGDDALRQVLLHDFAVILLDVNMPGIDGFETAALIRRRKRSAHTPIIFVTAFADELRTSEGYAHGAVDFILAPVVPDILRAKVKVFVDLFLMTDQVKRHAAEQIALAEERSRREAAEEANRRLSFLAHAGGVVGQSLDDRLTARDILRLVVPRLADEALIARRHPNASGWHVADSRIVGGRIVVSEADSLADQPAPWREAIERVVSRVAGGGTTHGETLEDPQTLILPLSARDRTFGVLVLSCASPARSWVGPEATMLEALVSRCAIALDNARLYKEVENADRQKNEFLSMLAHELRNPLAPIRSAVDVLKLRESGQPDVVWARDVIDRQVTHMVRLVDDLLDVSRITRGKIGLKVERLEVSQLVAVAVETSRPLIDAGSLEFQQAVPQRPIWLEGDRTRLSQVLANLLNNAAKYTPAGGSIWLSVEEEGAEVIVRVRDSGMGIPAEMLSKVFDLFTQVDRSIDRSQGGLGIGLTLVRKLVEMHRGSVHVQSDGPGLGSEFTVRLPAAGRTAPAQNGEPAAEQANDAHTPSGQSSNDPQRLRVLIVDDNEDGADALARLFRINGHDTRVVYDGVTALDAARQFSPEAVILDLGLPGIDGFEVARELRAQPETRNVALAAVSGYGQEDYQRLARDAGFDRHFAKPVNGDELVAAILQIRQAREGQNREGLAAAKR